jgi:hypothetical protein
MKTMGNTYITGLQAFNKMGLTTQVPNVVPLAGKGSSRKIKVKNMTIEVFEQKFSVEPDDIWFSQMLDALDKIKKIPDTTPDDVIAYTMKSVYALNQKDKKKLAQLAIERRPRTRALLGAIFQEFGDLDASSLLKKTLNPLSSYQVGISDTVLNNKAEWKIK